LFPPGIVDLAGNVHVRRVS